LRTLDFKLYKRVFFYFEILKQGKGVMKLYWLLGKYDNCCPVMAIDTTISDCETQDDSESVARISYEHASRSQ
jgi:hypothetical protein